MEGAGRPTGKTPEGSLGFVATLKIIITMTFRKIKLIRQKEKII